MRKCQAGYSNTGSNTGTDGGIEHSVVIYKGLIFDAMEEHALPFNLENLNRCGGPKGFEKFHCVHEYMIMKKAPNNGY